MVTLTVDGPNGQRNALADPQEWHLPTHDPKNENKYNYRLHTLDIYFWTKEDALSFLNGIRRVLPQQQITVQDEPVAPPAHATAMSPVVQKLESVAITDPSYQQGRTRDSRTTGFAGPPLSALPNAQEASNFTPLGFKPTPPLARRAGCFCSPGLQSGCASCSRSYPASGEDSATRRRGWKPSSCSGDFRPGPDIWHSIPATRRLFRTTLSSAAITTKLFLPTNQDHREVPQPQ